MTRQARAVFEDRRSGRHLAAVRERRAAAVAAAREAAAPPGAEAAEAAGHAAGAAATAESAAEASAYESAAANPQAAAAIAARQRLAAVSAEAALAARVWASLRGVAVVKSDYAAQLETKRKRNTTCGRPERHNLLVTIAEYRPYTVEKPGKRGRPAETVHKQNVDLFFAFHPSCYKPNARSYNVGCEDVDHYLKHGTFRHGEWFQDGGRCAGGDHSSPLPEALSERAEEPPSFPEYAQRWDVHDGAPTQFAQGTNFHQAAEWRSKTAEWAIAARARRAAARAARADEDQADPAPAVAPADAEAPGGNGIVRIITKLVERHGKGLYDALGNMPNQVLTATLTDLSNELDPGTRALVRYLAQHKPRPGTPKEKNDSWEGVGRIFWGYLDPSTFSKYTVPDADGFDGSKGHQRFIGLCPERSKVPMHMTCNPNLLPNSNPYPKPNPNPDPNPNPNPKQG